ncbi:MAG: lipopolysaccharide biosynthesis protein [Bacillota bacterium]
MRRDIFKNFSWIVVANTISSISKWLIIILIAKYLSVEEVGQYSIAFALTAPIVLLAQMKLRSLFVTENNINFNNYLYITKFSSLVAFLLIGILGIFLYSEYLIIILLVGAGKLVDLYSDIHYGIPHKNNNLKIVGKLLIIKSTLLFFVFLTSLIIFDDLVLSYSCMLLTQFLYAICIDKKIVKHNYKIKLEKIELKSVKNVLKYAFPLGIVAMVYSFTINTPRYFIEYYESAVILGYFSAIMYIVTVTNLLQIALSQIFLPKLSTLYSEKAYKKFSSLLWRKMMLASLILGSLLIIIIWSFGEEVLQIIYGTDYSAYAEVFSVVIVGVVINMFSSNIDTALMSMRNIKYQPIILIINFLITLILSFVFIVEWGIMGAAYTLILSNTTLLILRTILFYKKFKLDSAEY